MASDIGRIRLAVVGGYVSSIGVVAVGMYATDVAHRGRCVALGGDVGVVVARARPRGHVHQSMRGVVALGSSGRRVRFCFYRK